MPNLLHYLDRWASSMQSSTRKIGKRERVREIRGKKKADHKKISLGELKERGIHRREGDVVGRDKLKNVVRNIGQWVMVMYIVFGLGILSLAPHQEPRFLVPLITPLALLMPVGPFVPEKSASKWTRALKLIWIVFNLTLGIFFGVLHQGGVVPSLNYVHSQLESGQVRNVVFYHTYMPPRFLLAMRPSVNNTQRKWNTQTF